MADKDTDVNVNMTADIGDLKKKVSEADREINKLEKLVDKLTEKSKQMGKTMTGAVDESTQFQQMTKVINDFNAKMNQANSVLNTYRDTAKKAFAGTEPLYNSVSKANDQISKSYNQMLKSLSSIAGKDWDTKDAFKGLVQSVEDTKSKFGELETNYSNLMTAMNGGSNNGSQVVQSLAQIEGKAVDVSDSFKNVGQEVAEDISPIEEEADNVTDAYEKVELNVKKSFDGMKEDAKATGDSFEETCDDIEDKTESMSFSELGSAIEDIFEEMRNVDTSVASVAERTSAFRNTAESTEEKIAAIEAEMKRLESVKMPTEGCQELANELDKTNTKLENLYTKQEKMESLPGFKDTSSSYQSLQYDIKTTEEQVERLENAINAMVDSGEAFTLGVDSSEYAHLAQDLEEAKNATNEMSLGEISQQVQQIVQEASQFKTEMSAVSAPTQAMQTELENLEFHIDSVRSAMETMTSTGIPTGEFTALQAEIEKTEQKLYSYYQKQAEMQESGSLDVTSKSWKNLQQDIANTEQKVDEMKQKLSDMQTNGTAFTPTADSTEFENLQSTIDDTENSLDGMEMTGTSAFAGIGSAVGSVASSIGGKLLSGLKSVASAAVEAGKKLLSALGTKLKSAISKIATGIKDAVKNLVSFRKEGGNTEGIIKKLTSSFTSLWNVMKSQVMRSASRAILSDVNQNLVEIAKMNSDFNSVVSGLIDSCKQLGAQLIAVFEPIITTFGPILEEIIDMLSNLADKAAQFTARLMGQDTYTKATKGQSDYASSLDDTTDSTKKATKATKDYQNTLMGFDQINKLNDNGINNEEENSDESILGISDAGLQKAQTQATALNELADKIHDAFANGDFYGAGKLVGEGINEVFEALSDAIGWSKNADKITEKLREFIDFINGIADGLDGKRIGKAIGDILNTVVESANILFDPETGINFKRFGTVLGETIVAACEEFHWDTLGTAVMNGIQGAVQFINGVLEQDVGGALGTGLNTAFHSLVQAFNPEYWSELLGNIVNNITSFFANFFANTDDFIEFGSKIGTALYDGIKNISWDQLGAAIGEGLNAVTGFVSSLFEKNIGGELGSGLKEALETMVGGIDPELFSNTITNIAGNLSRLLDEFFGDSGVFADLGSKIFEVLHTSLTDIPWEDLGSGLGEAIGDIGTLIMNAFGLGDDSEGNLGADLGTALNEMLAGLVDQIDPEAIGEFFNGLVDMIIDFGTNLFGEEGTLDDLGTKIGECINSVIENFDPGEFFSGLVSIIEGLLSGLVSAVTTVDWWGLICKLGETIIEAIKGAIQLIVDGIGALWDTFVGVVTNLLDGLFSFDWGQAIKDIGSALWDAVLWIKDTVVGAVEDLVNGLLEIWDSLKEGLSKIWNWIKGLFSGSSSSDSGTTTYSISQTSIPALASGGTVKDGQLFLANENGAELISADSSGNTSVESNEQLVSAIESGVREAMMDAMSSYSDQDTGDIVLEIDSEEVARASTKGNRSISKRTNPIVSFA